jgi:hypothetical protein
MEEEELASYPVDPQRIAAMNAASLRAGAGGVQQSPLSSPQQAPAAAAMNPYGFRDAYAKIYSDLQSQAASKSAAQQEYLASLQKQEAALGQQGMSDYDRASMLFQAAGALGQPTRSGGLGETLGNLGTAMSGPLSKAAEAQRTRAQQLQQLQMARQKLGMEMAGTGGVDPGQALQLLKAQQDAQPKLGETERLLADKSLSPEDRARAIRATLKIDKETEKPEYRNIIRPDGSTMTVLSKNGIPHDPFTQQPIDLAKMNEEQQSSAASDRQSQALEYGVPILTADPYAALPQKDREKARLGRYQADTRVLQKQAEEVPDSTLRNEIMDYKRFSAYNQENQRTGPGWAALPNVTASAQNMKEIEARLTISSGKDLKGAASDRDVAMFGQAAPSLSKGPEANANVIKFGIMKTATELERRAFLRDYLAVNKTLEGADRKWDEYRNANPFFIYPPNVEPSKLDPSKLQENKSRLSYGDFFRQQRERGATPVTRNAQGQLVTGGQ